MTSEVLIAFLSFLSFLASLALLSALTVALTTALVVVPAWQARRYVRGLRKFLVKLRSQVFTDNGIEPEPRIVNSLAREEALQLVIGERLEEPEGMKEVRAALPRWGLSLTQHIRQALSDPEIFADFVDEDVSRKHASGEAHALRRLTRKDLKLRLEVCAVRLERRWTRSLFLTAFFSGAVVATIFRYDALELWPAMESGRGLWPGTTISALSLLDVMGFLITGLLCAWPAAEVVGGYFNRTPDPEPATNAPTTPETAGAGAKGSATDAPPKENPAHRIGRPNDDIRALNFSSGGFDTLMQLGVIHALVVVHGRAPDIVTGLSAGALHAAALAEVLQAGEEDERALRKQFKATKPSPSEQDEETVQRLRLLARVKRLREFIEAAQRSPERLLDAVLPDAYQIDVGSPLHPLQQPRFSPEERRDRAEFVSRRSGLARLYNDLLELPLTIGTLTRITRRVLGYIAADDLDLKRHRYIARCVQGVRLWVLLGLNLFPAALLAPILLRIHRPARAKPRTAGALIFGSRFWRTAWQYAVRTLAFALLLTSWMIVSLGLYPLALAALLVVLPDLIRYRFEPLLRGAAQDALQGMAVCLSVMVMWTPALVALTVLVGAALIALISALFDCDVASLTVKVSHGLIGYGVIVAATALIVGIAWWFIRRARTRRWRYLERVLASYNLGDSLFQPHGLRTFLSELFDLDDYPKPTTQAAVRAALQNELEIRPSRAAGPKDPRRLAYYSELKRLERIHVALAVANTETGRLEVVHRDTPVVDGLMAATAATPWFPPQELERELRDGRRRKVLYIDGANVRHDPSHALMRLLQLHRDPDAGTTHIYSVAPFPLSKTEIGESSRPKIVTQSAKVPTSAKARGAAEIAASKGSKRASPAQPPAQLQKYLNLVDIVWRAMRLRRFRDATLERRLTELYTAVLPPDRTALTLPSGKTFVRTWVTPIELEYDADLNRRLATATKGERRQIVEETVADGCRAALQVMIPDAIKAASAQMRQPVPVAADTSSSARAPKPKPLFAHCALAVAKHFESRYALKDAAGTRRIPFDPRLIDLPGSARTSGDGSPGSAANATSEDAPPGPGLAEICARCCVSSQAQHLKRKSVQELPREANGTIVFQRTLRLDAWETYGPAWPHEREREDTPSKGTPVRRPQPSPERRFKLPEPAHRAELRAAWASVGTVPKPQQKPWPAHREGGPRGHERATVSLLFSGGVFRGVFQIGVLNALHQLRIRPDIIAGASVGSITAALSARAFSIGTRGESDAENRLAQERHIAWLAATYLTIDRYVLTDRFADFIRNITVRASETRFSIRQADRVFRKYDFPSFMVFERNARRVVAGIERLFYVSPYQLNQIVRASRTRRTDQLTTLVRAAVQRFLDRMGVGEEAMGAEPLRELIEAFALEPGSNPAPRENATRELKAHAAKPTDITADDMRAATDIQFLATATNLTRGRLEVLGEIPETRTNEGYGLMETLLASSAFPGVFRPRWSWELSPGLGEIQQYIDGGVMDNLPIDAIAAFLHRAALSDVGLVPLRPPSPHLIIAASLEVNAPEYSLAFTRRRFRKSWLALSQRARQLGYNSKLDTYHHAEHDLRKIDDYLRSTPGVTRTDYPLVHVQLLSIKPNRLCGTFAFHPMLGFRRENQARSIAHGCAATLLEVARTLKECGTQRFKDWGIRHDILPEATTWSAAFAQLDRDSSAHRRGRCWLRPDCDCPFSRAYLNRTQPHLPATLIDAVSKIHDLCRDPHTHLREI